MCCATCTKKGAYAALALQRARSRRRISPPSTADSQPASFYSSLEQQIQIDFALDRLMDHPTGEPIQRDILRLSACQILFHDRVPDSAAVNEGVQSHARAGHGGARPGFLNAVLRNLVRGKDEIPWPKKEDDLREYLHVMGSTPCGWWTGWCPPSARSWRSRSSCTAGRAHDMVIRPNLMKYTDEAFETLLAAKAWTWRRGLAPHAYLVGAA